MKNNITNFNSSKLTDLTNIQNKSKNSNSISIVETAAKQHVTELFIETIQKLDK